MNFIRLSLLSAAVGFATVSGLAAAETQDRTPIPLDQNETLQIVVHDNVMPRMRDYWTTDRMENERYVIMKDALKRAAQKADYQGPIEINRFAAGIEDAPQRLKLYIYRWEEGIESMAHILAVEFTMEAVLVVDDKEWELGTFSARSSNVVLGGASAEDYRPAADRAIEQMVEFYRAAISDATTRAK